MTVLKYFIKGLKKGMTEFGNNLGVIINSLLLSIVYLIGVGLTSIFAKIVGKHFFGMKPSKKRSTYWSKLDLRKKHIDEYYRQF